MYLYSVLFVVPHTQGTQAWITQCYLQLQQCLPLPCKRSPDGASPDWGCAYLIVVVVVRKACTRRPNYRVTSVLPSRLSLRTQKCLQWSMDRDVFPFCLMLCLLATFTDRLLCLIIVWQDMAIETMYDDVVCKMSVLKTLQCFCIVLHCSDVHIWTVSALPRSSSRCLDRSCCLCGASQQAAIWKRSMLQFYFY